MADTVFVDGSTLSAADWFNDLNRLHYTIFGDPSNIAAAQSTFLQASSQAASVSSLIVQTSLSTSSLTVTTLNIGSDAVGDLYYRNSNGHLTRLGIGSEYNILQTNGTSTAPQWGTLSTMTSSLGADVPLSTTAQYFTGPQVAQGTSGTWAALATVTLNDSGAAATFNARLTDGTTIRATGQVDSNAANQRRTISLFGVFPSPAGNIRMTVRDASATSGSIKYNDTGDGKDSTITVVRIG